jgi:putative transposase
LKKLGVRVARSTVVNILKEAGLDPGPRRGLGSWADFVSRHVKTMWACDFFTKKVWTLKGLVDVFVLCFIHVDTRRLFVSGMTANPDAAWVKRQAKNFAVCWADSPLAPSYLVMDMDSKFTAEFRDTLRQDGIESVRVGPLKPNLNAFAERFVQTIERECLDHFVVFGLGHLQHLVSVFVQHYNRERPHQGVGNRPLSEVGADPPPTLPFPAGEIVCEERLGGLLKHYRRIAA